MNYSILSEQERDSVRSKFNGQDPNKAWLGLLVFHTYVIDLRNLVKNKLFICREYHIQPSEIDRMQYWEYEWYTDNIKEITKEQEKQQKEQEKEYAGMRNPTSMMRNAQQSIPKVSAPSMPSISIPNINIPHF